jgi:hypothetical protein
MNDEQGKKDLMFQRLAKLIKERFDTTTTFTDLSSRMRMADVRAVTTVQRNPTASFIAIGKEMLLPVRSGSNLYGFLTLFDGINLQEEQLTQIRQVTDLLLTETCILEDKARKVKILEHHLKTFNSFEEVIDLRTRMEGQEIEYINPEISIPDSNVETMFPILVECHSQPEAAEFAIEIHRTSHRSSFLTYESYLALELHSVEKIQALGPVTLFFPNVRDMDLSLQMTIESFLRSPDRTTHHPRIICGVQENPDDLVKTGELSRGLFDKLCSARVKLPPKGTSAMSLEEMMGFFNPAQSEASQERHLYLVTPAEPSH